MRLLIIETNVVTLFVNIIISYTNWLVFVYPFVYVYQFHENSGGTFWTTNNKMVRDDFSRGTVSKQYCLKSTPRPVTSRLCT